MADNGRNPVLQFTLFHLGKYDLLESVAGVS